MEDLFELFETDAVKVILYHGNKEVFADLIDRALNRYQKILEERQNQQNESTTRRMTGRCLWNDSIGKKAIASRMRYANTLFCHL